MNRTKTITTTTKKNKKSLKKEPIKNEILAAVEVEQKEIVKFVQKPEQKTNKINTFLFQQQQILELLKFNNEKNHRIHRIVPKEQLDLLIKKPQITSISNLLNLVRVKPDYVYKTEEELYHQYLQEYIATKDTKIERDDEYVPVEKTAPDLSDYVISSKIFDKYLPEEMARKNAKKVLILTDTDYQQTTRTYQLLIKCLRKNGIFFVEYTNIQPRINRKLVWDVAKFGHEYNIDSIIAFGSWPLIDFSKILVVKLANPNLRHLSLSANEVYTNANYAVFSIPTIVCMEDNVNATSVLFNSVTDDDGTKKFTGLKDLLSLITPSDNSDCSFFYPEILLELSTNKLKEALIETYFRIILNFFDRQISDATQDQLAEDAKFVHSILTKINQNKKITENDCDQLAVIIVRTVDGTTYLPDPNQWNWYFLESALSAEFNSKKSENLALLAPNYFKQASLMSSEFKQRAMLLAEKLYNKQSIEGLILEIMGFISEFNLPRAYLDLPEAANLTPDDLVNVIRFSNYLTTSKLTKKVIKEVPLY
ncbi:Iron-containing alcohol dehydrogenase [[Mycoplasma] cavipharyngis]|uniref:iron-containing alcohol dehydrogenase n=1 Tax=[Mycoplasma] cavipharyngis TaxID=92757 RepID=UPI0037047B03